MVPMLRRGTTRYTIRNQVQIFPEIKCIEASEAALTSYYRMDVILFTQPGILGNSYKISISQVRSHLAQKKSKDPNKN